MFDVDLELMINKLKRAGVFKEKHKEIINEILKSKIGEIGGLRLLVGLDYIKNTPENEKNRTFYFKGANTCTLNNFKLLFSEDGKKVSFSSFDSEDFYQKRLFNGFNINYVLQDDSDDIKKRSISFSDRGNVVEVRRNEGEDEYTVSLYLDGESFKYAEQPEPDEIYKARFSKNENDSSRSIELQDYTGKKYKFWTSAQEETMISETELYKMFLIGAKVNREYIERRQLQMQTNMEATRPRN